MSTPSKPAGMPSLILTIRLPQAIFCSIASVNAQSQVIEESRQQRIEVQRAVARELNQPEESPVLDLLPLLPAPHSVLIVALVSEINALIARVRERAEENHRTLRRSTEMMKRVVVKFVPPEPPSHRSQELITTQPLQAAV